jgi:hypothetical protein
MDGLCGGGGGRIDEDLTAKNSRWDVFLKGLSHEIDFKNFDKHLQNLV